MVCNLPSHEIMAFLHAQSLIENLKKKNFSRLKVNFSRFSFDGIFFHSCDNLVRQVRQNNAANLKMKMWCLKSSWINWGRAGDPLRGSSYFPAPPPRSWHFHKLPVWLRCPTVRTFWFLGLQTPLTGSCTQVQLCVPGPTDRVPQHKLLEKMLQFCTGSQREYLFLGCLAVKQCQLKCRLGPFNCVNPLSRHKCYKNEKSKEEQENPLSVQSMSLVWLFVTPWTAAHQDSMSITNSWSLRKLMRIESVMPSNHLVLCHPLLLPPSIFPSIRGSSNESVLHIRWPKYWSFSFSISPSNEYSGLISFRMDLLVIQGTLKSLLQHHNSKASIRRHSSFFMVQLTHPYVTTGKTTALTRWTFVGKVWCLTDILHGKISLMQLRDGPQSYSKI